MGWGTDQAADTSGGWGKDPVAKPPMRAAGDQSIGRKIDAGVRGAADMLTFGFADELAAAGDSIPDLVRGGTQGFSKAYQQNLQRQRATDQADKADVPVSRGAGQVAGFAGSLAGGAILDAGRLVPNALRGGGLAGNVARGAVAGAGYGELSGAGQGDGNIPDRLRQAIPSAVVGAAVGGTIPVAARVVGAGINALANRNAAPLTRAANALRGSTDVPVAQARVNALRDAGAEPSFASGTDESGRGLIRAAASRQTPAREIVQQRAETAALNLPDRISGQARQHISPTPRARDHVVDDLETTQRQTARTTYAQPYAEPVAVIPEALSALQGHEGQAAIQNALEVAQARRDDGAIAALEALQESVRTGVPTATTGAALDRVQIAMGQRARNLTRSVENANPALASGVRGRQADINANLDGVPGLAPARAAYRADQANINAAEAGDNFLRPGSADEFAQTMGEAGDLTGARAVAARRVEQASGENPSAAPSIARRLAYAPEQQARNAALLGQEGAQRLQAGMGAEARTVRDLSDVAPRTGSQTQLRSADQAAVSGIASVAHAATGGPAAWAGLLVNRMKTLGLSDRDAQAVADIATDPAQVDALLARIAQHGNPQVAQQIGGIINQITGRTAGQLTAQRQ